MSRVIHFELYAEDPERVIRFYTALFGWEFSKWAGPMDYWLIKTGPEGEPGINGGLTGRRGPGPLEGQAVNAYVCTVSVPSVDESTAKITANGGQIALPKMAIPGIGWLAYGKDTEGNIFGVMNSDPTAH
jgi:uncharacterized protein